MRAVVQRVSRARVLVDEKITGEIENGLCVFLGVAPEDGEDEILWMAEKIVNLRIFEDSAGKMNLSLMDEGWGMLVVSQFTLYGDCRKGRRPSFAGACGPEKAKLLYERFIQVSSGLGVKVESGIFQAFMRVELCNDGPVTLIIDTDGGCS
ncbi:MAG: D-aminoacyl-tRNA deacylase [Thermovirgaceae bacterium]|nr:D-aminoacyl-tRNA deacylase [Thermovirgaceae bacterium]